MTMTRLSCDLGKAKNKACASQACARSPEKSYGRGLRRKCLASGALVSSRRLQALQHTGGTVRDGFRRDPTDSWRETHGCC